MILRAYKGSEKRRQEMISLGEYHANHEQIIGGSYGEGKFGTDEFRGCTIGCYYNADHKAGAKLDDIPLELLYLLDGLFEATATKDKPDFHRQWPKQIKAGADLSLVVDKFLYWLIHDPIDGVIALKGLSKGVISLINKYEFILNDLSQGKDVDNAKKVQAASAVWAAGAARVAWESWESTKTQTDKLFELMRNAPRGE